MSLPRYAGGKAIPVGGPYIRLKEFGRSGRVIAKITPKLGFYGRFIRR